MDGIDATLVDFSSTRPHLLATHSEPYPETLHQQLLDVLGIQDPRNADLRELDAAIGNCFAQAANQLIDSTGLDRSDIKAIGSHGQTIRHEPEATHPYSLQIGSPETIAGSTQIDVIADFRNADIRAGGQGAPLVPGFHKAIFSNAAENRVVVNIGGIANITVLPGDPARPVTGFDTGPGNTLMDAWIRKHRHQPMDAGGSWAAGGTTSHTLLEAMLSDPYFHAAPPKSTGLEHFNISWLLSKPEVHELAPQDVQATLCTLTSKTIADAINTHATNTKRLLVCGGGIHNNLLIQQLESALPGIVVESTADHGLDPDWVEAAAFAWLAKQLLEGKPGNVPEVTGASQAVLLGKLFRH